MLLVGVIQLERPGTNESFQNFCYEGEQENGTISVEGCGIKVESFFFNDKSYNGEFVTRRSDVAGNDKLTETKYPIRCNNLSAGGKLLDSKVKANQNWGKETKAWKKRAKLKSFKDELHHSLCFYFNKSQRAQKGQA